MQLVPWLLLIAATIFALSRPVSRWLDRMKAARQQARPPTRSHRRRAAAWFSSAPSLVCFYIGYFGAGAGFLIITLLSFFGFEDLNEINALKVVSTTAANGIAFLIFVSAARWSGATACWPWSPAPSAATLRPVLRVSSPSRSCAASSS